MLFGLVLVRVMVMFCRLLLGCELWLLVLLVLKLLLLLWFR